jgi:hypothetical protein
VHAASFSSLDSNNPPQPDHRHHHHSPTKAKDFFKRVIKRRSRTPLNEQASKRVRSGSAEPDDWEAAGRGKGHRLGGSATEEQKRKESGLGREAGASTKAKDEKGCRQETAIPPDAIQGLDLGRVLNAFRVTPSQLR